MQVELRSDGVHISGYVNVTGKMSKPLITPQGIRVVESIEERAFQRALEKVDNVPMTLDHEKTRVLAETSTKTLELREDSIGLHAKTVVTDPEVIQGAKEGKLKGWSFGMRNVVHNIEERTEGLPIRHVKEFDLDHITLVMRKNPAYAATSIELRAEDEEETQIEIRAIEDTADHVVETPKKQADLSQYINRINRLKVGI